MHNLIFYTEAGCTSNQLECSNGQCIPASWQCDGYPDCFDGSDETDCSKVVDHLRLHCTVMLTSPYTCRSIDRFNDVIFYYHAMINLKTDCSSSQIRCSNGLCIPAIWLCYGYPYCTNGTNSSLPIDCSELIDPFV